MPDRLTSQQQVISLLTATIESTADGILVVDSDGKIILTNTKFAELWRIPPEVLANGEDNKALEYVLGQLENPEVFLEKVRELYRQPDAESFDVLHFADGRTFERYSLPQRIDGRTVGRVWSFRDVTEQRKLEDELRHSHKMEAIGLLAGGIAHDFNNLLTVIRANAELLEQTLDPAMPQRQDAHEIMKAAARATELARQLLAFGRKQILQSVFFDLNAVLSDLGPMLRRLIGESIEITTRLSSEPSVVFADRGQMEQVLVNLVINARDAMPRGGLLTIETTHVRLNARRGGKGKDDAQPADYVLLRVSDTGVGIPRDQIDRVFEPFFTTKDLGKGTGLGLSTLYGIVKQSGGHIDVESEVGTGTTFSIHLPRAEGKDPEIRFAPPASVRSGGSETILVAEDEEAVRLLIVRLLEADGYTVLGARNGRLALELAREHLGRIDLLVSDVIMPELGGRELARALRELRPGVRVLYISGYTSKEVDRRGLLQDAAAFLQKPFTGSALGQAVRAALDASAATTSIGAAAP